MITNDAELAAARDKVQSIEAVLAHTRRTMAPEDFELQSKGWLREWDRLEAEIREYIATPAPSLQAQLAPAA